jgi:hypothetical protein
MTMDHTREQFWAIPDRLKPAQARLLLGLSVPQLITAGLGFKSCDGWYLVAHISAFALIGLNDFAWGLGSLLPEERGGITMRSAMRPVGILSLIALCAVIGFQPGRLG